MNPPLAPHLVRSRRLAFLLANLLVYAALLAAVWHGLGGSWLSIPLLICVAAVAPWNVLGFTTAIVGGACLARRPEPAPIGPTTARTAILMTLRNEDPTRALGRLAIVQASLDATGHRDKFGFFVLSDTDDPVIAAREDIEAARLGPRFVYRRRTDNVGYKAGNIMDFCETLAGDHTLMIPLDADSLMSGAAVLRLVRIMQDQPQIGIVQSLVTGLPAQTVFTRAFQFGMRAGMRSYTVGQDWWVQDCGPFWGHNAILRVAPFRDHCRLPVLSGAPPFGGHILSHDQVEATLMRRAGFEVRLQPVAGGSWEENPPTMIDYIRRDLRWCQGNLQYLRLIGLPGLRPVSRFQLVWAISMFAGIPAGTLLLALLPLAGWALAELPADRSADLVAAWWAMLAMTLSAKLVGYAHTLASGRRSARYGGRLRFAAGAVAEIVLALLQNAIATLSVTGFILSLVTGRSLRWLPQPRDARQVGWREAWSALWPHTLFGLLVNGGILLACPGLLPWALPYTLGSLAAVPFTVLTSRKTGFLWRTPEESSSPGEVAALHRFS